MSESISWLFPTNTHSHSRTFCVASEMTSLIQNDWGERESYISKVYIL